MGWTCQKCEEKIRQAKCFASEHFHVPARYKDGVSRLELGLGVSHFLIGPPGVGKTWAGYAFLRQTNQRDPRLTIAAYSWPSVLVKLQAGYHGKESFGEEMTQGLRRADVAMLDDLGAERITTANLDWLRQILFVILDERWAEMRTTILTTNLEIDSLPEYLGDRIVSRIMGMCEIKKIGGPDRRL